MKPIKSIGPLAAWMLRLGVLLMIVAMVNPIIQQFDVGRIHHIISAVLALFGILLFVGGFFKTSTLTMISGIVIMLLCGYLAYTANEFSILNRNFTTYLLLGMIGFHFFVNGNK